MIPVDRFLAPLSYFITVALMLFLVFEPIWKRVIRSTTIRIDLGFSPKPALRILAFPWQLYRLVNVADRKHISLQIRHPG